MSSDKHVGEDNASYVYDPAQRERRARWRRAVVVAEGARPVLYVVLLLWTAIVLFSSIGAVSGTLAGLMRFGAVEAEVPELSLWTTLRRSGALEIMALVGGFMVLSAVAAGVRVVLGDAPGTLYLGDAGGGAAIVREARAAAIAARQALGRLQGEEIRRRLEPHVDALDATTWTMATVMATDDSRELQEGLARHCQAVKETAAELAQLVDAEATLESLVPAIPPMPPPDPATILEANDILLQSAHDEIRSLVRAIAALTGSSGDCVSTASYDGAEVPSKGV